MVAATELTKPMATQNAKPLARFAFWCFEDGFFWVAIVALIPS